LLTMLSPYYSGLNVRGGLFCPALPGFDQVFACADRLNGMR